MLIDDWTPTAAGLPDDDTLVILALIDGEVWPGYRDGDTWRDASAMPIADDQVTDWTNFPAAPARRAA